MLMFCHAPIAGAFLALFAYATALSLFIATLFVIYKMGRAKKQGTILVSLFLTLLSGAVFLTAKASASIERSNAHLRMRCNIFTVMEQLKRVARQKDAALLNAWLCELNDKQYMIYTESQREALLTFHREWEEKLRLLEWRNALKKQVSVSPRKDADLTGKVKKSTVLQIAELILTDIYGERILKQRPWIVSETHFIGDDGVYESAYKIEGTFHGKGVGGVGWITLGKKDLRVVNWWHGK